MPARDRGEVADVRGRTGRFNVSLASGGWSIYMAKPDGSLDYHSSINIAEGRGRQVMVVSR